MENIGDWLYMVILIIVAFSSFIGSINKKSKQAAEKQPPREIVAEDWEGTEGDPWLGNVEPPKPVLPEIQPVSRPQLQTQQMTVPAHRPVADRKKATIEHRAAFKPESFTASFLNTEEEKPTVSLEDMPTHTDEWRKAFIYHEVFQRKY
jgi:hypothetical protein